ncbi:hypothetical protein [Corynebacterium lubricantis]|uniref:hypothetical protein n=1 Tax=Corynebacterium lubricantis TaxID=541095 RepID=UPI00037F565C|nr:hypothetical protein [Corynebacterium lubricantis]
MVGVYDASDAVRVLASRARKAIEPPMQLGAITSLSIEGHSIVYCVVPPQPLDKKPFRVKKTKKAYIRSGDGDYELNDSEEQLLVNQRSEPIHEQEPVLDASVENDLADDLLEQYLQARISEAPRLQMLSRQEQLVRTSVIDLETGKPTLAAIYAFGIHPQQFFPTLSVKARAIPAIPSQEGVRIIEPRDIGGPIPDLLESTMEWLSKVSLNAVSFDPSGHGKNVTELPGVAVREIVANALVHRDLSVAGRIEYVNVIKEGGKLTVSNPGGLWGLSVKQLGRTNPKPRNPILYGMCSKIATQNGNRVIEASATGIPGGCVQ